MSSDYVVNNNVVDYYTNKDGDLFLKYFLIDSSFNTRGWAVDKNIIETLAKRSIGAPFTDYSDFPVTKYRDQHPWALSDTATFKDHYDYAHSKQTGYAVDVSPTSNNALKSASGSEIKDGYFVTIKITDPVKKALYLKNPERIPKISAGVFDYDNTPLVEGQTVVKNADIVHFAGVERGAYGEKARVYASCQGGYECVNHLKGASNTNQDNSSLGNFSTSEEIIMTDNNPLSTSVESVNNSSNELTTSNPTIVEQQNNNNNNNEAQLVQETKEVATNKETSNTDNATSKQPFRLKTQKYDFSKKVNEEQVKETNTNKKEQQEIKTVPDWKQDKEYLELVEQVKVLRQEKELEQKKQSYAEIIPRELFILNGKFDVKGYNAELEKAVSKNLDQEFAKDLYNLKLEKLKLSKTGKPYGASSANVTVESSYKTPDTVPVEQNTTKGASDINSSQFAAITNIRKMIGLVHKSQEVTA